MVTDGTRYVDRYAKFEAAPAPPSEHALVASDASVADAAAAAAVAEWAAAAAAREVSAALELRALHQYIVTRGEDLYLKMLMVDHLMHTDLHPGNIIVEPATPALVLVDAGMVSCLTSAEQHNFIGFIAGGQQLTTNAVHKGRTSHQ